MIDWLEKHRRSFNDGKLNYFIDQCLENRRCLFELENYKKQMVNQSELQIRSLQNLSFQ
jgi:hypothetical protein